MMRYKVSSVQDLTKAIIPHFEKYPLVTQKRADSELLKMVVEVMKQKNHLTLEGLHEIVSIRASINKGLAEVLAEAFPYINPVDRPKVEIPEKIEPNWIAGFTEGEACFDVKISESKTCKNGVQVTLRLRLTQHSRDLDLMNSIMKTLGCGTTKVDSKNLAVTIAVTKFSEISDIIIPFFAEYPPLQGAKRLDYIDL
jgi:hypothetical protein